MREGDADGLILASLVGTKLGCTLGTVLPVRVGDSDGAWLGLAVGDSDGPELGLSVGLVDTDGGAETMKVGSWDGEVDGTLVGPALG